jgi:hypothetical protein
MTTNITLKVDAALLKEARQLAAREGTSVSRYLAEVLESRIREARSYDRARRKALELLGRGQKLRWTPGRSRQEVHER